MSFLSWIEQSFPLPKQWLKPNLTLIQRQGSYLLESIWEMAYIYRVKPM
jgi:hypothetical protein